MNEREYVEFLEAVAVEYIRPEAGLLVTHPYNDRDYEYFRNEVDNLASTAQLARVVGELRGENELLRRALGSELQKRDWGAIEHALDAVGVTEALDRHGVTLYDNFRRSVVPEADLDILRRAGIEHPEATLRVVEERARVSARFFGPKTSISRPSNVLQSAKQELKTAGGELNPLDEKPAKKSRKWFKGISRILAGGAGALGNVVVGVGLIPVAAPVSAVAILGSCTGGLVLIGDGIEDLQDKN